MIRDVFDALVPAMVELTCVTSDDAAYRTLAESRAFDVVLVDVNLGRGTTGYDVARRARAIHPDMPVIYISGQIDQKSVDNHGVAGSVYLRKPFTSEQLLEAVAPAQVKA